MISPHKNNTIQPNTNVKPEDPLRKPVVIRGIFAAICAGALVTGCALSPQTVTLTPALTVAKENIGNGHTIKVLVTDTRNSDLIGTRGGIYEKTSEIRSDNDVAESIRQQVTAGLIAQGYADGGNEAVTKVRIRLTELRYSVPPGAMTTSADMKVALEVAAERGGGKHTATYRSEMNRRFPVSPSARQNETWLNELLGETLQRFFSDEKMRAFMTE